MLGTTWAITLEVCKRKNGIVERKEEKREMDVNAQRGINIHYTSVQKYIVFVLKYQFWTIFHVHLSLLITRVLSLEKFQKVSS